MKKHLLIMTLVLAVLPVSSAQEPPDNGEIRQKVRELFEHRLREQVGLTDVQFEFVAPRIQHMEQNGKRIREERRETWRTLRQGLSGGMRDEELQALLDRLVALESEERVSKREVMKEIDAELTVRQRVELRIFLQDFRRELNRKVRDIRERRRDGRGPHFRERGGRGPVGDR